MNGINKAAIGLVAAVATVAMVPSASFAAHGHAFGKAAKHQGARAQRGLVLGSLTAFNASSATVTPAGGSGVTVTLAPGTRYIAHRQAAAIAGFKAGEQVAVFTVTRTAGPVAAAIEYDTVPFGVPVRIAGTVASLSATSLTIATAGGSSVTVQLNAATKFAVNGTRVNDLASIPVNGAVFVLAAQMTNGGTIARVVVIGQGVARKQRVLVRGTIASFVGTTLSINTKKGSARVTVQIAPTTRFIVRGALATAAPAFTPDQRVLVIATKQSDGSLFANTVIV